MFPYLGRTYLHTENIRSTYISWKRKEMEREGEREKGRRREDKTGDDERKKGKEESSIKSNSCQY